MKAALAAAYAHGPGKAITPGPAPEIPVQRGIRRPLPDLPVARLLTDVLGPGRWEPWNQYNDHRAYPSPRSAYLVDVDVVAGDRRWPVDPVRRATIGGPVPWETVSRLEFRGRPDRISTGYGSFADALVELETGHLAAALVEYAPRHGLAAIADEDGVTLRPGPQWTFPLPARSSGLGPRGLGADPRPLPAAALATFCEAVARLPHGTLTAPELRYRLAVRNVLGVDDGWYTVDPFKAVKPGSAMDSVQAAFGHARDLVDVGGMNLALVVTADVPAAVTASGPGAYPALLRAAGACAQHASTAAAHAGLFCRPVRSVEDPLLEAAVDAPMAHSLLYVLLAGRPRVLGFPYDLTPLVRSNEEATTR